GRPTSTGCAMPEPGWTPPRCAASARTVGWRKTSTIASRWSGSRVCRRSNTEAIRSESPPTSKNRSSTPTRSSPRTSRQTERITPPEEAQVAVPVPPNDVAGSVEALSGTRPPGRRPPTERAAGRLGGVQVVDGQAGTVRAQLSHSSGGYELTPLVEHDHAGAGD